jgi:hypothetical protein
MGSFISSYNTVPNADRSATYSGYGAIQPETNTSIAFVPAAARLRTDKAGDTLYKEPYYVKPNPALLDVERYDQFHAAHNHD